MEKYILKLIDSKYDRLNILDQDNNIIGSASEPILTAIFGYVQSEKELDAKLGNYTKSKNIILPFSSNVCKILIEFVNNFASGPNILDHTTYNTIDKINFLFLLDFLMCDKNIISEIIADAHCDIVCMLSYHNEFIDKFSDDTIVFINKYIKNMYQKIPLYSKNIIDFFCCSDRVFGLYRNKVDSIKNIFEQISKNKYINCADKNILIQYILDNLPKPLLDKQIIDMILSLCKQFVVEKNFYDSLPTVSNKYLIYNIFYSQEYIIIFKNYKLTFTMLDNTDTENTYICELDKIKDMTTNSLKFPGSHGVIRMKIDDTYEIDMKFDDRYEFDMTNNIKINVTIKDSLPIKLSESNYNKHHFEIIDVYLEEYDSVDRD